MNKETIPCMGSWQTTISRYLANVLSIQWIVTCESISHAFFKCSRVKEVWAGLGLTQIIDDAYVAELNGIPIIESLVMDFEDSVLLLLLLKHVDRCDLAAVAMLYIW